MLDAEQGSARQDLLSRTENRVRILTLNRPERSNALSQGLIGQLVEHIRAAADDPEIRVVLITGAGERSFCAGADLKELAERDAAGIPFRGPGQRGFLSDIYEALAETYKPTIAALNGHAVAGGLELALACDIRIASEHAKLGLPEAKRGMGAAFGTVVLPRLIPAGIALELLFTGDYISAADAARWGLMNHVVAQAEVFSTAMTMAQKIADNAPLTLRRMKETAVKAASLPLPAALRLNVGPDPYQSEDRKEGVRAFIEGRKPNWQNR